MDKRYWFVVIDYSNKFLKGKMNLGFVSDKKNPLNNETIRNFVLENNKELNIDGCVIVNFIEFKTETEYTNFWKKQ